MNHEEAARTHEFKKLHALLNCAAGDAEEVASVCLSKAAVAYGNIGGDREGGAVELVGEGGEAAGKPSVRAQIASAKSADFW